MIEPPKQRCKHCGTLVEGAAATSIGFTGVKNGGPQATATPFSYRFECPKDHEDRIWYWTEPDQKPT